MNPKGRQSLTALLAGATGLVGGHCLARLLDEPAYRRVIVITRRDIGPAARNPRVRQVVTEFDRLAEIGPELAADHVFCALGSTMRKAGSKARFRQIDFAYPLALAQVTRAEGARHFSLVSAMGASPRSPFFYSRVKGDLEQALGHMDWPGLAIFRPSVIAGQREEARPGEGVGEFLLRMAPARWKPVAASDIAVAMVNTALSAQPGTTIIESSEIPGLAAVNNNPAG
jgi:uncharacterized protein YbjT (DUF2867 family)